MTRPLPLNRRRWILASLSLALLLGLTLVSAPATSHSDSGSTWHRGPAGYSTWYSSLEQQGITVQRWQRPVDDLLQQLGEAEESSVTLIQNRAAIPETLVVVLPGFIDEPGLSALLPWMPDWIEAGHRLVVLGIKVPATAAPFSQTLTSEAGPVKVDTRRRYSQGPKLGVGLEDEFGAVVWQQALASGQVTMVATPHLAANAYANQPGNFALLTELVTSAGGRVWIDEYLHGYRDEEAIATEVGSDDASWLNYLARTPLAIVVLQALAVTLLALLALNRRLGQRQTLPALQVDNSRAYIHALAGVLHKAGSRDFVVQTLSQAERIRLQKSLGLGNTLLPVDQLQAAWNAQTNLPATDLAAILNPPTLKGESQLRDWLKRLQSLHYPGNTTGDTSGP
ncbi:MULTISPECIES: DUF4350 domain-containing protein [Cyanophyceae]|uniref:DUF4350 domain-containing protein n=1 Tax=Leptolyngbya subtilissima DQ-A4 TaxID=2933933 RepID=A0ABV0K0N1_9CYAN|nr:DUF4350 domain-containing protein [Nodosilinea sp. FACHB-141]MBD2111119.1 DUF4350 domain-containing protein [Nodosilinea sp. FACHB-141]